MIFFKKLSLFAWFQNTTMLGHLGLSYSCTPLNKYLVIDLLQTEKHMIKNEFHLESSSLLPLSNPFLSLGLPPVGTTFPPHLNPSKNDKEICKE